MEYRKLGKTGMSASVVGLGAEHLDEKPYAVVEETIRAALDHQINIMDVFMPGEEVRKNIGKAIAGNRDKFILQGHICSTDLNQQYDISRDLPTVRKFFENLLKYLGTDYIDVGMLFFIDSPDDYAKVFETGIIDYALDLKRRGIIRALGASSHNPAVAKRVVETGLVEVLMFSINPAFDMMPPHTDIQVMIGEEDKTPPVNTMEPARAELYRLCEQRGVGITVMKTLGAGKLLSDKMTPFSRPLTVGQCIHYALTRPAVVSTLIGCQSRAHVEEAVGYLKLSNAERDYASVISNYQGGFKGSCVYCSHCLPCPSDIDIAAVNRHLDVALLDEANIPLATVGGYKELKRHGSDCVACGSCESRCPFSVPVIKNMERAAELFGE